MTDRHQSANQSARRLLPYAGWAFAGLTWASNQESVFQLADFVSAILTHWKNFFRFIWSSIFDFIPIDMNFYDYQLDCFTLIAFLLVGFLLRTIFRLDVKPIFKVSKIRYIWATDVPPTYSLFGVLKLCVFIFLASSLVSAFINRGEIGPEFFVVLISPFIALILLSPAFLIHRHFSRLIRVKRQFSPDSNTIYVLVLILWRRIKRNFTGRTLSGELKALGVFIVALPILFILGLSIVFYIDWFVGGRISMSSSERVSIYDDIQYVDLLIAIFAIASLIVSIWDSMRPLLVAVAVGISILVFGVIFRLAVDAAETYFYT